MHLEPSPTVEEIMFATARLQEALVSIRNSVVLFTRTTAHPEGGAWFAIIEGNIASAHSHLSEIIDSLKDCNFKEAAGHASIAKTLIFSCRYISEFNIQHRTMWLPDDYNTFMRDANDSISQLNGHMMNLHLQIERKLNNNGF